MKVYSLKNTGTLRFSTFNLSINNLVAAEGRYHTLCRSSFDNPFQNKYHMGDYNH